MSKLVLFWRQGLGNAKTQLPRAATRQFSSKGRKADSKADNAVAEAKPESKDSVKETGHGLEETVLPAAVEDPVQRIVDLDIYSQSVDLNLSPPLVDKKHKEATLRKELAYDMEMERRRQKTAPKLFLHLKGEERIHAMIKNGASEKDIIAAAIHEMPSRPIPESNIYRQDVFQTAGRIPWVNESNLTGYDMGNTSDTDNLPRLREFTRDEMNKVLQDVHDFRGVEKVIDEQLNAPFVLLDEANEEIEALEREELEQEIEKKKMQKRAAEMAVDDDDDGRLDEEGGNSRADKAMESQEKEEEELDRRNGENFDPVDSDAENMYAGEDNEGGMRMDEREDADDGLPYDMPRRKKGKPRAVPRRDYALDPAPGVPHLLSDSSSDDIASTSESVNDGDAAHFLRRQRVLARAKKLKGVSNEELMATFNKEEYEKTNKADDDSDLFDRDLFSDAELEMSEKELTAKWTSELQAANGAAGAVAAPSAEGESEELAALSEELSTDVSASESLSSEPENSDASVEERGNETDYYAPSDSESLPADLKLQSDDEMATVAAKPVADAMQEAKAANAAKAKDQMARIIADVKSLGAEGIKMKYSRHIMSLPALEREEALQGMTKAERLAIFEAYGKTGGKTATSLLHPREVENSFDFEMDTGKPYRVDFNENGTSGETAESKIKKWLTKTRQGNAVIFELKEAFTRGELECTPSQEAEIVDFLASTWTMPEEEYQAKWEEFRTQTLHKMMYLSPEAVAELRAEEKRERTKKAYQDDKQVAAAEETKEGEEEEEVDESTFRANEGMDADLREIQKIFDNDPWAHYLDQPPRLDFAVYKKPEDERDDYGYPLPKTPLEELFGEFERMSKALKQTLKQRGTLLSRGDLARLGKGLETYSGLKPAMLATLKDMASTRKLPQYYYLGKEEELPSSDYLKEWNADCVKELRLLATTSGFNITADVAKKAREIMAKYPNNGLLPVKPKTQQELAAEHAKELAANEAKEKAEFETGAGGKLEAEMREFAVQTGEIDPSDESEAAALYGAEPDSALGRLLRHKSFMRKETPIRLGNEAVVPEDYDDVNDVENEEEAAMEEEEQDGMGGEQEDKNADDEKSMESSSKDNSSASSVASVSAPNALDSLTVKLAQRQADLFNKGTLGESDYEFYSEDERINNVSNYLSSQKEIDRFKLDMYFEPQEEREEYREFENELKDLTEVIDEPHVDVRYRHTDFEEEILRRRLQPFDTRSDLNNMFRQVELSEDVKQLMWEMHKEDPVTFHPRFLARKLHISHVQCLAILKLQSLDSNLQQLDVESPTTNKDINECADVAAKALDTIAKTGGNSSELRDPAYGDSNQVRFTTPYEEAVANTPNALKTPLVQKHTELAVLDELRLLEEQMGTSFIKDATAKGESPSEILSKSLTWAEDEYAKTMEDLQKAAPSLSPLEVQRLNRTAMKDVPTVLARIVEKATKAQEAEAAAAAAASGVKPPMDIEEAKGVLRSFGGGEDSDVSSPSTMSDTEEVTLESYLNNTGGRDKLWLARRNLIKRTMRGQEVENDDRDEIVRATIFDNMQAQGLDANSATESGADSEEQPAGDAAAAKPVEGSSNSVVAAQAGGQGVAQSGTEDSEDISDDIPSLSADDQVGGPEVHSSEHSAVPESDVDIESDNYNADHTAESEDEVVQKLLLPTKYRHVGQGDRHEGPWGDTPVPLSAVGDDEAALAQARENIITSRRWLSKEELLDKQEQHKHKSFGPVSYRNKAIAVDPEYIVPKLYSKKKSKPLRHNWILTVLDEAKKKNVFGIMVRDKEGRLREPTFKEFLNVRLREKDRRLPFLLRPYLSVYEQESGLMEPERPVPKSYERERIVTYDVRKGMDPPESGVEISDSEFGVASPGTFGKKMLRIVPTHEDDEAFDDVEAVHTSADEMDPSFQRTYVTKEHVRRMLKDPADKDKDVMDYRDQSSERETESDMDMTLQEKGMIDPHNATVESISADLDRLLTDMHTKQPPKPTRS